MVLNVYDGSKATPQRHRKHRKPHDLRRPKLSEVRISLPFSCPFTAPRCGKRWQRWAQSWRWRNRRHGSAPLAIISGPMTRYTVATLLLVTTFLAMVAAEQAPTAPASAPPVVVPASSDEATVTVHLTDVDALTPQDITAGPLASALKPNYHVVAEFRKIDVAGEPKNWTVTLVIGNLIPFGESTVPLLVRGQLRQTLRFQKPGLVARAPVDDRISSQGRAAAVRRSGESHLVCLFASSGTLALQRC